MRSEFSISEKCSSCSINERTQSRWIKFFAIIDYDKYIFFAIDPCYGKNINYFRSLSLACGSIQFSACYNQKYTNKIFFSFFKMQIPIDCVLNFGFLFPPRRQISGSLRLFVWYKRGRKNAEEKSGYSQSTSSHNPTEWTEHTLCDCIIIMWIIINLFYGKSLQCEWKANT